MKKQLTVIGLIATVIILVIWLCYWDILAPIQGLSLCRNAYYRFGSKGPVHFKLEQKNGFHETLLSLECWYDGDDYLIYSYEPDGRTTAYTQMYDWPLMAVNYQSTESAIWGLNRNWDPLSFWTWNANVNNVRATTENGITTISFTHTYYDINEWTYVFSEENHELISVTRCTEEGRQRKYTTITVLSHNDPEIPELIYAHYPHEIINNHGK